MKIRIASILLAFALLIPMASLALADGVDELEELTEQEEPVAVFYLDEEPLYDVTAQCIGGTYYVTLASVMALIDPAAVVEEDEGVATLTAEIVVVTEPETDGDQEAEEPEEEDAAQEGEAVTEVLDTLTLTAEVGQQYIVANGRYLYAAGGIITLEDEVAVPIRLLAKALELEVEYEDETGFVKLTSGEEPGYLEDAADYYDEDDLYWLSRIIYCESGNQSLVGKLAVGNVVLNRVENSSFPDTIYDVIFQKNQFSPASSGSIYRTPGESSVIAAKLVLDGAQVLDNALFFNTAGLVCYASKYRSYITTIGAHAFYA